MSGAAVGFARTAARVAVAAWCCGVVVPALCSAAAPTATDDAALASLMHDLAARTRSHATFTERKTLAVLSRPVESSGELLYVAPDHLEKRTLKPREETLRLDGDKLTMQRGRRSLSMALRDAPQAAPFIDTIRATLAGDLQALQRSFSTEFHAAPDGWTLQLVPRDAALLRTLARVRIAGAGSALREVAIDSADGDRSVMLIHELPAP